MKLKNIFLKAATLLAILGMYSQAQALDIITLPFEFVYTTPFWMTSNAAHDEYIPRIFLPIALLKDKNNESTYVLNEDSLQELGIHDEVVEEAKRLNSFYLSQTEHSESREEFICANTKSEDLKQLIGLACSSQK
ncbi:MAG: hypothetical protein ACXVCY_07310 [Pseudobdellovibrionaceae bacterium]